ncbi:DUF4097 family beta strand repeat-containing protein [Alkalibacillus silvisoli]|uniref:Adhesin domain-containing protein n=1 Tax=Alkalibacillus silvisoli TaxID=392823 RepID=A0ABN1ABQ3_9BACI
MNERRKKILNLLEEGHITAEEADELLEALEQNDETESKTSDQDSSFTQSFKKDLKNVTNGIANFIDETVNMVKEGPFEFSFKHASVKRSFDFNGEWIKDIELNNKNGTVEFLMASDDQLKVEVRGKVFKESEQERAEALYDEALNVATEEGKLLIKQERKDMTANFTIYLPKKMYENVSVKTFNGTVKMYNLACQSSQISTVNGTITLLGYKANTLSASTRHGSIKLDDVSISKVKLKTATGSVHYDGTVEQINIEVTTGSVRSYVRNYDAKSADLSVATGSVQLYVPKGIGINGTAGTSVSSVKVELVDTSVEQLEEQTMKRSTQFYKVEAGKPCFDVDLSTKTGSIRVNNIS